MIYDRGFRHSLFGRRPYKNGQSCGEPLEYSHIAPPRAGLKLIPDRHPLPANNKLIDGRVLKCYANWYAVPHPRRS